LAIGIGTAPIIIDKLGSTGEDWRSFWSLLRSSPLLKTLCYFLHPLSGQQRVLRSCWLSAERSEARFGFFWKAVQSSQERVGFGICQRAMVTIPDAWLRLKQRQPACNVL